MIRMPFITETPNNETKPTAAEIKSKRQDTAARGERNAGKR